MLTFDLYPDDFAERSQRIHVNPAFVVAVIETEQRRSFGGYSPVGVITMHDGAQHVVDDTDRTVADQFANAQAHAEPLFVGEPALSVCPATGPRSDSLLLPDVSAK